MAAAIEEEGASNSLSEVGNSTEYVESLDESVEGNEEVVKLVENDISLPQNKDDKDIAKYPKRKESNMSGLNWVGAKKSQRLELEETDEQIKQVIRVTGSAKPTTNG